MTRAMQIDVWYTLRPDAAILIRSLKLDKNLLALFSQCQATKAKTPILKVRAVAG